MWVCHVNSCKTTDSYYFLSLNFLLQVTTIGGFAVRNESHSCDLPTYIILRVVYIYVYVLLDFISHDIVG